MINRIILERLKQDKADTLDSAINSLREVTQEIILLALYKNGFFKKAAFYGGTCLRIFHGLERFSEDLDFALIDKVDINLNDYEDALINELKAYGLNGSIRKKADYDTGEIKRRYINIEIYDLLNEYFDKRINLNRERQLSIKLEVDTTYIKGAILENNVLFSPNYANIISYDLSSLFAGKIHAIICRTWKNRVKGRDYYDYLYYLKIKATYNLEYLQNKLANTLGEVPANYTHEKIKELLNERFNEVDIGLIIKDLESFIDFKEEINNLDNNVFIKSLTYLIPSFTNVVKH